MSKEKPATKLCKYCKSEIPYEAKVCPKCRKKQKGSGCLIAVVIMIVIIAVVSCFGLGSSDSKKKIQDNLEMSKTDSAVLEAEKKAESETEENMEDGGMKEAEIDKIGGKEEIEEQVLLEWEGLKITAKELTDDIIWGKGLKVLIENDSAQNLGINSTALIVNHYMITDLFSESVAAGKKSNAVIYFSSQELEAAGIENIGQIELYFHVYNSDSYAGLYDSECVVVQTSAYSEMDDSEVDEEGKELLNQDGIRIVGKYVDENSFWGKSVLLYVENHSGKNITVTCDDVSVNGFMISSLLSSTVYNEKKALDNIMLLSSDLEENDIEEIHEIELKFRVYESESFRTLFESDVISFSVD